MLRRSKGKYCRQHAQNPVNERIALLAIIEWTAICLESRLIAQLTTAALLMARADALQRAEMGPVCH